MNIDQITATTIRKADNIVVDLNTATDCESGLRRARTQIGHADTMDAIGNYIVGFCAERLHGFDVSQSEVMERLGFTPSEQSKASKGISVARAIRQIAEGGMIEGLSESKANAILRNAENISKYWNFAHEIQGYGGSDVQTWAMKVSGVDGQDRADVMAETLSVFPTVSFAYDVARGAKVHPNDPRANQGDEGDDGDEGDESGDEDGDDKVSWQDRLAALVAQAALEGAKPSEILAVVNAALKSQSGDDAF